MSPLVRFLRWSTVAAASVLFATASTAEGQLARVCFADEDCPGNMICVDGFCDDGRFDDICAQEGWYGDGICDEDCPRPDPDCQGADPERPPAHPSDDVCAQEGWYGDGVCDGDCPRPDPDCHG